jgi:hypothetical protein
MGRIGKVKTREQWVGGVRKSGSAKISQKEQRAEICGGGKSIMHRKYQLYHRKDPNKIIL